MKYLPPVCDCGHPLIYWRQEGITVHQFITKSGRISNKRTILSDGRLMNWDRLVCLSCNKQYHFHFDEQDRVHRDEHMNQDN